jgi:putative effector of murein hydrolase
VGVAGLALLFAWFFTKHYFMGRNENVLHMDPLSLGLVVLIPLSIYFRRASSKAVKLAGWIAAICLLAFVAQGLPLFDEKNGEVIALALPINLAVWWTVYRLTAYRRTSLPSSAAL